MIRPLGAFLGMTRPFGGVSVPENSDVVLILYPPSVLRAVGEGYGRRATPAGGRMMQEHDGSTAMNVVRDRSEIDGRSFMRKDPFTTRKNIQPTSCAPWGYRGCRSVGWCRGARYFGRKKS